MNELHEFVTQLIADYVDARTALWRMGIYGDGDHARVDENAHSLHMALTKEYDELIATIKESKK